MFLRFFIANLESFVENIFHQLSLMLVIERSVKRFLAIFIEIIAPMCVKKGYFYTVDSVPLHENFKYERLQNNPCNSERSNNWFYKLLKIELVKSKFKYRNKTVCSMHRGRTRRCPIYFHLDFKAFLANMYDCVLKFRPTLRPEREHFPKRK